MTTSALTTTRVRLSVQQLLTSALAVAFLGVLAASGGGISAKAPTSATATDVWHQGRPEGSESQKAFAAQAVPFRLPDRPSDDDFLQTGLFVQPLVPVGTTTPEDNHALAQALVAYENAQRDSLGHDAVDSLVGFLGAHPHSPWKPALLVNLGAVYRQTGHLSQALATWQTAWHLSKAFRDKNGRAIGDFAVAYLSQFEAYLGRKEELAPLLDEVKARPIRGAATELVRNSWTGFWEMLHRPEISFKCGPMALSRILLHQGVSHSTPSVQLLESSPSTPNGLSLSSVQALSVQAGMNYQMAFRGPGAPLIAPAVVHWKLGHYAAIVGADDSGVYQVQDPTFGGDIVITAKTLDEEASGYFLLPPGPLPPGWRTVDSVEASTIWGRGNTGTNHDTGATGPQEIHAFPCPPGGGCSTWNVEAATVSLSLHDDPVGTTPPLGPPVRFPLDYSYRDTQQPSTFWYTNFGNKWTTGWLSYLTDLSANDPTCLGTQYQLSISFPGGTTVGDPQYLCSHLYRRGGGEEAYYFPIHNNVPVATSLVGQFSQTHITRSVDGQGNTTGFLRMLQDGSTEEFQFKAGSQFFMTQVVDPQGNAVTLHYDSMNRITGLTDALGQTTTLCYSGQSTPPCQNRSAPDPREVTQVTDPFSRSAYFTYDPSTSHLTGITDVLGIASTFTYAPGSDFVQALTTPYGTTTFTTDTISAGSEGTDANPTRFVQITDPLGAISRVEFTQGGTGCTGQPPVDNLLHIPCSEPSVPSAPMQLFNDSLEWRNTFIWDPPAYGAAFPSNNPYLLATVINWQHTTDQAAASRVPQSEKRLGEGRVWFNYPFPNGNAHYNTVTGSTNQPISIGRIDGTTVTQDVQQYQYNSLGHVTQTTDPVGRQFTYGYAPNQIDLLTTTNTTPGTMPPHNDLLGTFGGYTNHRPDSYTAANGNSWSMMYSPSGQLESITDNGTGRTVGFTYSSSGLLTNVKDLSNGNVQLAAFTPDTTQGALPYRVGSYTDVTGFTIGYKYDAADRIVERDFPDGTSEKLAYTNLDLHGVTDRMGRTTLLTYDANRQLVAIDRSGRHTDIAYYPGGQVEETRNPRGVATFFERDARGRIQFIDYPDASSVHYAWDDVGRPAITPNGIYTYNTDSTVAGIDFGSVGGQHDVSFLYDPAYRRVIGVHDAGSDIVYTYASVSPSVNSNTLALVSNNPVVGLQTNLAYTYDPDGRLASQQVSARTNGQLSVVGTETFTYDGMGRLQVDANALDAFTYGYSDASTRVTSVTPSTTGAPQLTLSYFSSANDGLLQSMMYTVTGAPSNVLAQFGYTYYSNEQVKQFTDSFPKQGSVVQSTYTYDSWDELKQVAATTTTMGGTFQGVTTYGYDTAGNQTSSTNTNNGNTFTDFTPSDAIGSSTLDTVSPIYDSNGNPLTLEGYTYTWDPRNRLVSAAKSDGTESDFTYDGLGHLIRVVEKFQGVAGEDHGYTWCGNKVCLQVDNRQQLVTRAYFEQGTNNAGNPSQSLKWYYGRDRLGSVRYVWRSDSSPISNFFRPYDEYGNAVLSAGLDVGFAGYFHHAQSNLYFAEHRAYTPYYGRWLNRDPIGFFGGSNLYAYGGNDPVNTVDPAGTCPWCVAIAVGVVLGYGAFAPSDTAQAPADVGALMALTGAGFSSMGTLVSAASGAAVCGGGEDALEISAEQFGKKVGKHASDYGLDAASASDREILRGIIRQISNNPDNVVQGTFRGQEGIVDFFIKGNDVVVAQGGQFVTLLKDGITNPAVVRALGLP